MAHRPYLCITCNVLTKDAVVDYTLLLADPWENSQYEPILHIIDCIRWSYPIIVIES